MRLTTRAILFSISSCTLLFSQQTSQNSDVKVGDVTVSGWLRTRSETWNWFDKVKSTPYTFSESIFRLSFSESTTNFDWKFELAVPLFLNLPNAAVQAAPQGQLGFGGSYFAANHNSRNAALAFPKQGYLKYKFGDTLKQSVQVGRSEFLDGGEVAPKNATLSALKKDRVNQRLIGNFGFSDVGRSFDGGTYTADSDRNNITLFGARPTRGVFQADGWGEINVNLFYGGFTHQFGKGDNSGELRVFAIGYNDFRYSTLKTDNRPTAVRALDKAGIDIATFGGHYIQTFKTGAGSFDTLLWGAGQTGSWGSLTQRAYAFATEGGYQPPILHSLKPWIRAGIDYGSGDKNASDGTHGTFFQILPTARNYARFPFFNMMNMRDIFGEVVLRPVKGLTLRSDVHWLALANSNDLWYSGGGAYNPWTFGFTGRPSNGASSFANLVDISADYTLNRHWQFGLYYGHAAGKTVIQKIYPGSASGDLGYLELNYRF
jgi:hypothetical protein